MDIKLSTLAIVMGLGLAIPQCYALAKPQTFGAMMRKFPRSIPTGAVLMLLGTAWFIYYLNLESVSEFTAYKPMLLGGFAAVGIASCIFVQDFLAVRGFAVLSLLLAKLVVDTARWADSEWRLVLVIWAYLLVVAGIWFTIYPWHLRDAINWGTASEKRIRVTSLVRLAFGIFVTVLGFTVFKAG